LGASHLEAMTSVVVRALGTQRNKAGPDTHPFSLELQHTHVALGGIPTPSARTTLCTPFTRAHSCSLLEASHASPLQPSSDDCGSEKSCDRLTATPTWRHAAPPNERSTRSVPQSTLPVTQVVAAQIRLSCSPPDSMPFMRQCQQARSPNPRQPRLSAKKLSCD